MNARIRMAVAFGLAAAVMGIHAAEPDKRFFRIASTQQTHIVSLNSAGLLVWSNTVPNAIRTNGSLAHVRVPMVNLLGQWVVAFKPDVTLEQAETLFESSELIWRPLGWNSPEWL